MFRRSSDDVRTLARYWLGCFSQFEKLRTHCNAIQKDLSLRSVIMLTESQYRGAAVGMSWQVCRVVNETYDAETETRPRRQSLETETFETETTTLQVCTSEKVCFRQSARKLDSKLALRMSFGMQWLSGVRNLWSRHTDARMAVSVRVHGTERRGASADRRDRVVTRHSAS